MSYNSDDDGEEDYCYDYQYTYSGETESSSVSSRRSQRVERDSRYEEYEDDSDKRYSNTYHKHHSSRASHSSYQTTSSDLEKGGKQRSNGQRSSHKLGNHGRKSEISRHTNVTSSATYGEDKTVIALFGAYGVTGHYFLQFALQAGYHVRALIPPGVAMQDMQGNDNLTLITGALDEAQKVGRTVKYATYVVCMLNECDQALHHPPRASDGSTPRSTLDFVKLLYPLLKKYNMCRVFLYQASSSAVNADGKTPLWSHVCKKLTVRKSRREFFQEQDEIVSYISNESSSHGFDFVVTRPGSVVWDLPSRSKLAASKSQPVPFPIMNEDLAEFSLNALLTEKIYNSCPYIVPDSV